MNKIINCDKCNKTWSAISINKLRVLYLCHYHWLLEYTGKI